MTVRFLMMLITDYRTNILPDASLPNSFGPSCPNRGMNGSLVAMTGKSMPWLLGILGQGRRVPEGCVSYSTERNKPNMHKRIFLVTLLLTAAAGMRAQVGIPEPQLEFVFEAVVTLDPPREVGITRYGNRRIIGINGGHFIGPKLKGDVLPGGADWQTVRADGTADLVANYSLKTHDGVIIFIENKGIRTAPPEVLARLAAGEDVPASEYYMRTSATLEVADNSPYAWLNRAVIISTGMRKANSVILRFYKVL